MEEKANPYKQAKPYTIADMVRSTVDALRMKVYRRPVLIAGPYVGEFGHELIDWQGYIRNLRRRYDQVHVITYPGREYLYEGCTVHCHDIHLESAGYFLGNMGTAELEAYARRKAGELGLAGFDLFHAGYLCTRFHRRLLWRQTFKQFAEPPLPGPTYDVLFHFRAINKAGPDHSKNYNPALAQELATLCQQAGLRSGCIGHPNYARCPAGCADLRRADLRDTIQAICSSRIICGELSGPMHLAMLCGKPIVTWVPGAWRLQGAYRRNPFHVPIGVAGTDTTQVPPAQILSILHQSLPKKRMMSNSPQ